MQKPTWFDTKHEDDMKSASAEQALQIVAKDSRVIEAVREALREFDSHPGRPGPSRTQAIRGAIVEVLNAD